VCRMRRKPQRSEVWGVLIRAPGPRAVRPSYSPPSPP
jgi:hypothetical protein